MAHAAELDLQIPFDSLERDFLARIAGIEIDLAKPATANAALDDKAFQRSRTAGVLKANTRAIARISAAFTRICSVVRSAFARIGFNRSRTGNHGLILPLGRSILCRF